MGSLVAVGAPVDAVPKTLSLALIGFSSWSLASGADRVWASYTF
jgi:hypothetical protein